MSPIRELTRSACLGEITMCLPSESVIVTSGIRRLIGTGPFPFFTVVDEGTLRRPVGEPGVMHRQLAHLLSAAEQPT